jgi:uncharacterized protein (DUF427 family)
MKTPGPDHPITLERNPRRVRVMAAGHVIADSTDVITLHEADYGPVQYFPRTDVERGFLSQSPTVGECPYKGPRTHYTALIDGELLEDIAWSYEKPNPAAEGLRDRFAFDANRVEVYEVDQADLDNRHHPQKDNPPPFANM